MSAAYSSSNIVTLELTLGEVSRSVANGENAVKYADLSLDAFRQVVGRIAYADALHQAGRCEEAHCLFSEAEKLQAISEPKYPRLYSLRSFRYCNLLLDGPERVRVANHAIKGTLPATKEDRSE